jgi:hypothetical protein
MMKKLLVGVALVSLLATALVLGLVNTAGGTDSPRASEQGLERKTVTPRGNFELSQAKAFKAFPLYTLGDSFRDLPLNAVIRVNAARIPGETVRADHMTFMYGSCESVGGQGCLVPLQVQVGPGGPAITADESLRVRGVPAAFYEDFSRLELYSGFGTIVIFAAESNRELLIDSAEQLRGYNVHAPVTAPLPALGRDSKPIGCAG